MRTLVLVAVIAVTAWLLVPASAEAQPNQFFGGARPVPFRYYNYGWDPQYGAYVSQRGGWVYPGSGYNWGFVRIYSPTYGITTGNYRGLTTAIGGTYQYTPTYVAPGYFAAQYNYASPAKSNGYADRSYVKPQYYLPTY